MVDWSTTDLLTIGGVSSGLGVIAKSLFDFLRHRGDTNAEQDAKRDAVAERRERMLWTEIGKLQGKVEALEKRLDSITAENVRLMLENAALKNEVDDLLEAQGKPTKYHTPSMTTTTTTTTIQQPGVNKS